MPIETVIIDAAIVDAAIIDAFALFAATPAWPACKRAGRANSTIVAQLRAGLGVSC